MIDAVKKIFTGSGSSNLLDQVVGAKLAQLPVGCRTVGGANAMRAAVASARDRAGGQHDLFGFLNEFVVPFVILSARLETVREACAADLTNAEREIASAKREIKSIEPKLLAANGRVNDRRQRLVKVQAERDEIAGVAESALRVAAERLEAAVLAGDEAAEREASEVMAKAQAAMDERRAELARIDVRLRALRSAIDGEASEIAQLEASLRELRARHQSALLQMALVRSDMSVQEHLAALAEVLAQLSVCRDSGIGVDDPRMEFGGIGSVVFYVADARRSLIPAPNESLNRGAFTAAHVLRCLQPFEAARLAELERFVTGSRESERHAPALAAAA